jgi:hypothetical protein
MSQQNGIDLFHQTNGGEQKPTFFNSVFDMSEGGKAEVLNILQYALLAIIPIVILNKTIQRFIPDADTDSSSLELTFEIIIQIFIIFISIILIHRIIVYIPTYSGFKYENLNLISVIGAFLIIVLSVQTKLGIKVNILVDRLNDLWNGTNSSDNIKEKKKRVRVSQPVHIPSQADQLDDTGFQQGVYPPAPVSTASSNRFSPNMEQNIPQESYGPVPFNAVGGFGSSF